MKKFDWGKGIFIVITLFIIGTLSMVSYLISLDFYMVNNNHYEEGVEYQQTIDSKKRASQLVNPVVILFDEERIALKILFPDELLEKANEGTINLYRPNDSSKDRTLAIQFDAGNTHVIPMERMDKGKWILTINWKMENLEYQEEKVIII
ncbi:MAG: FixH family protein [Balneolaceae bacterium]